MHPFLLKSFLAVALLASAFVGVISMFEVFGRAEKRCNIESLKTLHRFNGIIFFSLSFVIAFLCLDFLLKTRTEPSIRAMFHAVFALAVLLLLLFKVLVVVVYRQFYAKLQTAGFILAFVSFAMIGTSAGYFLLITKAGSRVTVHRVAEQPVNAGQERAAAPARTDPESISMGREIYESKCWFCHDAYSNDPGVGPGHKGILKNPLLPVSRRPATPENIANQIRSPYKDMPSFSYLTEDEVQGIIAFLNTL